MDKMDICDHCVGHSCDCKYTLTTTTTTTCMFGDSNVFGLPAGSTTVVSTDVKKVNKIEL